MSNMNFDPNTGKPLNNFDPNTGKPLNRKAVQMIHKRHSSGNVSKSFWLSFDTFAFGVSNHIKNEKVRKLIYWIVVAWSAVEIIIWIYQVWG